MDLFFLDFLPICNTRCCIRSPAWPTYSTPDGTRVLTPGCRISAEDREASLSSAFGISVAKRAAVPALHVPILRCRIKAFGVVPSQPVTSLWTAGLPSNGSAIGDL